jgi:hypothetical protein
MSYPISTARKILYDAIMAEMTIDVYDAIAPDDAAVPFAVFDSFSMDEGSKCGYNVTCNLSIYDLFNKQGGNIRADQQGEKLLRICEAVGTNISVSTAGVRTFNRANYRQQFSVTINDLQ